MPLFKNENGIWAVCVFIFWWSTIITDLSFDAFNNGSMFFSMIASASTNIKLSFSLHKLYNLNPILCFALSEINNWLQELKTSQVNNSNKDYINYLIKEKNKSNEKQDYLLKLKITEKLKDNIYEREFKNCEKQRNENTKTFDLKWEKPKFYRAEFR